MLHIITKQCIISTINGGMGHGMVKHKPLTGEEHDHLCFHSALYHIIFVHGEMGDHCCALFCFSSRPNDFITIEMWSMNTSLLLPALVFLCLRFFPDHICFVFIHLIYPKCSLISDMIKFSSFFTDFISSLMVKSCLCVLFKLPNIQSHIDAVTTLQSYTISQFLSGTEEER
jgi:hypothetical protein